MFGRIWNINLQTTIAVIHLPSWYKTHLRGQRVVHKDIRSRGVWSEGPDRPSSQQIPVVLCLEKLSQLLPVVEKQKSYCLKVGVHIMLLCQLEH